MSSLMKYGNFNEKQIKDKIVKFGKGSIKMDIVDRGVLSIGNGYYPGGKDNNIYIYKGLAEQLENATGYEKELALLAILTTILHESVNYGDNTYRDLQLSGYHYWDFKDRYGYDVKELEIGKAFEIEAFWDNNYSDFQDNQDKHGDDGMKSMNKLVNNKRELDKLNTLPKGIADIIQEMIRLNPAIKLKIK